MPEKKSDINGKGGKALLCRKSEVWLLRLLAKDRPGDMSLCLISNTEKPLEPNKL